MDSNPKILSNLERRTLEAVAERIFPKTDSPGAVEIGALDYLEIALAGDYAALLPLYRAGLRALNRHAKAKCAGQFARLDGQEQDRLLKDFESGSVAGFKKAAEFFETVKYHVFDGRVLRAALWRQQKHGWLARGRISRPAMGLCGPLHQ